MAATLNDESATLRHWQESDLSKDLSFLLARVNAGSLADGNSTLKDLGLKPRSYAVLSLVCNGLEPAQRDLATFLRLDPSQVVALLDELEQKGLVKRQPDPRDRRSKIVAPTTAGRKLNAEAREAIEQNKSTLYKSLTATQLKTLANLLHTLAFN